MIEFMNGDLWVDKKGKVEKIISTLIPNKLILSEVGTKGLKVRRDTFRDNYKPYVLMPRPQPKGFVTIGYH